MAITYTPTTNFGAKDSLPTNDPDKVIKGSEFTTEFTAIQTAFGLAAPAASPTFTGTVTIGSVDINGGAIDGTTIGGATPAAGSFTTVSATGNITVGGTVDGRDVAADGTKLDGVEAGADVTDTANVTAAGALMDSELTDIAAVKALNQGVATTDSPSFAGLTATTADINGGTADGVVIGGSTPAAITGTTVTANTSLTVNATTTITDILDEDDMSSDSATALATQQSIKAYVDSQVGTVDTLAEILANGNTTGGTDLSVSSGDDITFADSSKAIFGAGSDLQIYHNGSNSFIQDAGSGDLYITTNGSKIDVTTNGLTEYGMRILQDSYVSLYHDNSEKFRTTATGIDVTGTVTADGLTVDGSSPDVIVKDTQTHTTTDGPLIQFQGKGPNGTNYNFGYIQGLSNGSNNAGDMVLGTNTAGVQYQRMRLEDNGDISFYEDTGTTAKFFWDASAEALGIGTTSPTAELTIASTEPEIRLSDTNEANSEGHIRYNVGVLTLKADPNDVVLSSSMRFEVDGSEAMRIDDSGNVGIGITSPNANLAFGGNSAIAFNTSLGSTGTYGQIKSFNTLAPTNPATNIRFIRDVASVGNDGAICFDTVNTERLRIDSSGRVGIGTTTFVDANAKLAVSNGTITLEHYLYTAGNIGYIGARSNHALGFTTNGTERARIDTSGNLLVGTTVTNSVGASSGGTSVGVEAQPSGEIQIGSDGDKCLILNRQSSDGEIVRLRKDGTTVGSIGTASGKPIFGIGDAYLFFDNGANRIYNCDSSGNDVDNNTDLGYSSARWDDIYATNGTIQTSDRNEKQDIEELSEAERRVAVAAKGLLRKFRWISSVEEKGDDARIHFGIIAQDLEAAFEAEGLDAGRYAMFIHSTWTDEETGEERSRMGVRYSELLAFIIAAL